MYTAEGHGSGSLLIVRVPPLHASARCAIVRRWGGARFYFLLSTVCVYQGLTGSYGQAKLDGMR